MQNENTKRPILFWNKAIIEYRYQHIECGPKLCCISYKGNSYFCNFFEQKEEIEGLSGEGIILIGGLRRRVH